MLAEASILCKEEAVVAGIEEALSLLRLAGCEGSAKVQDGGHTTALSGVATATAELVSTAKRESGGKVRVACTRKTLPGLRHFEKRAVELGGGDTHRLRLDDAVLIKDNHLTLAGSIRETVRKAKTRVSFTKKIEVEATTPDQAVEAAEAGADIVLLDNMTTQEIQRSLSLLEAKSLRERVLVEASGGITRENIASYAKTGVDVVSVGAITHSARAIDMSMEVHASKKRG